MTFCSERVALLDRLTRATAEYAALDDWFVIAAGAGMTDHAARIEAELQRADRAVQDHRTAFQTHLREHGVRNEQSF